MQRRTFASGTPWEQFVGYSRAVRVGPHVYVSGTTATDSEGRIVGGEEPYVQAVQCLENLCAALAGVGARIEDVVRTRTYVTRIEHWEAVGRAHGEVFRRVRPCATLVAVSALVAPEMLVEIECEALCFEDDRARQRVEG
jgi:enamine deaminase RidA (YjgF/YER057c/UK114 family)